MREIFGEGGKRAVERNYKGVQGNKTTLGSKHKIPAIYLLIK